MTVSRLSGAYQREELTGEQRRARGVEDGLPPIVALATQISTTINGNMVSYRGSGPIPPGLYHDILTGEGRPKPVTAKAKSSTIGPQAGRAVVDPRNGRYDKQPDGLYTLRAAKNEPVNSATDLKISLRHLYNDMNSKYSLEPSPNPDDKGILRFHENHESKEISDIIYSVDLNEATEISREIVDSYRLVSDQFKQVPATPRGNSPFFQRNLDALVTVSAQHPGDSKPAPIQVKDGIVRDCDIDIITDPPGSRMSALLGTQSYQEFLKPLDMSAHADAKDAVAERMRANKDVKVMVNSIMKINDLKWGVYEREKEKAKSYVESTGNSFDQKLWEVANAHHKPFVPHGDVKQTLDMVTAMVVTVGKGTPMQLYQSLEINILEQKILASTTQPDGTKVNIPDIDSQNPMIRNAALTQIHDQKIDYSKDTIARAFIQHPAECHNEYYTSARSSSVAVCGNHIILAEDAAIANLAQNLDEHIPINPKWIAEKSDGNQNAVVWTKHFINNYDHHYQGSIDTKVEVDNYLKNPKNIDFIKESLRIAEIFPQAKGSSSTKNYLNNFLDNHPEVKKAIDATANAKQSFNNDFNNANNNNQPSPSRRP